MKPVICLFAFLISLTTSGAGIFDFFSGLWSSDEKKVESEATARNETRANNAVLGQLRSGVTKLNVREKPSRESRILKQIDSGVQFEILSSKPGFVAIVHDNDIHYAQESCIEQSAYKIRDEVTALNVRSGPEADAAIIRQVNGGIAFELLSRSADRMQIRFTDQSTGYIHQDYAESQTVAKQNCEITKVPGALAKSGSLTQGQSLGLAGNDFIHIRLTDGTIGFIASQYLHSETKTGDGLVSNLDYQAQSDLVEHLHHRLKVTDLLAIKVFFTQKEISPLRLRLSDFRDALREVFQKDSGLSQEYAQEISSNADDVLRNDYLSLLKMMNSNTLLRNCGANLVLSVKNTVACIRENRGSRNNSDREVSGKPRIMINLPGSRLQVFDDEGILLDYRVVIGHRAQG